MNVPKEIRLKLSVWLIICKYYFFYFCRIVDCVTPVLTDDKIYQMYQTAWKGRKDNLDLLALGKMILDYDYASYSTKLQRLWNIIWFFDGHPVYRKCIIRVYCFSFLMHFHSLISFRI